MLNFIKLRLAVDLLECFVGCRVCELTRALPRGIVERKSISYVLAIFAVLIVLSPSMARADIITEPVATASGAGTGSAISPVVLNATLPEFNPDMGTLVSFTVSWEATTSLPTSPAFVPLPDVVSALLTIGPVSATGSVSDAPPYVAAVINPAGVTDSTPADLEAVEGTGTIAAMASIYDSLGLELTSVADFDISYDYTPTPAVATPEPGTISLMLIGVGVLGFMMALWKPHPQGQPVS